MSRVIEMSWVCSACGTSNLGRYKVCQRCGDPKDAGEKFVMPGDTRAAQSVVDPKLLQKARAGADWRCRYCGYDQSALDGTCARCGASQVEGQSVAARAAPVVGAPRRSKPFPLRILAAVLAAGALVLVLCGTAFALFAWIASRPVAATVARLAWEHAIVVERYRAFDREGFSETIPRGATDVRSLGPRHHHDEQVLDHYETVPYSVDVLDHYDTETYTEHVSCGEDCTTTPQSCHEECTSNDNGFASCHEVCSGGGRSCTTRYCDETRTRQVPRYRSEMRTRQEPRYRSELRFAEAFAFRTWEWAEDRTVRAAGTTMPTRWPSAEEVHLGAGLATGERERERRVARYEVHLVDGDGRDYAVHPANVTELERLPLGSHHTVRGRGDHVEVDPHD